MTMESLPPEKRITGRSNSPATSRKMCTASDSRASRCDSAYGLLSVSPVTLATVVMRDPSR